MKTRRSFLAEAGAVLSGLSIPAVSHAWGWRRRATACRPCPPCFTGPGGGGSVTCAVPDFDYGEIDGMHYYECVGCSPNNLDVFLCMVSCSLVVTPNPTGHEGCCSTCSEQCHDGDYCAYVNGTPSTVPNLRAAGMCNVLPAYRVRAKGHNKKIDPAAMFRPAQGNGGFDSFIIYPDPNHPLTKTVVAKVFWLEGGKRQGPCRTYVALEVDLTKPNAPAPGDLKLAFLDPNQVPETSYHHVNKLDGTPIHSVACNP